MRDKIIHVRLSKEEYSEIRNKAKNPSTYMRNLALCHGLDRKDLVQRIAVIDGRMNRLSREIVSSKSPDNGINLLQIHLDLLEIKSQLAELLK